MKKKDINLIMAAVAVLVMLKTMINRAFDDEDEEYDEDDYDEDENEDYDENEPYRVSDEEYEYFNEILESVDLENLTEDTLEEFDLNQLLQSFSDSLEFKLAIMKNSKILKEMVMKKKEVIDEEGEAISDI